MARRPSNFRQRDLAAAMKAMTKAGASVTRVEITNNKVLIVLGEPDDKAAKEIDPWLAELQLEKKK